MEIIGAGKLHALMLHTTWKLILYQAFFLGYSKEMQSSIASSSHHQKHSSEPKNDRVQYLWFYWTNS